jgi:hypothetical protein
MIKRIEIDDCCEEMMKYFDTVLALGATGLPSRDIFELVTKEHIKNVSYLEVQKDLNDFAKNFKQDIQYEVYKKC